jgi:hypothetical protein
MLTLLIGSLSLQRGLDAVQHRIGDRRPPPPRLRVAAIVLGLPLPSCELPYSLGEHEIGVVVALELECHAVIGRPSPEQADVQHAIREITRTAVALVTSGRPVSQIAAYCEDAIADLTVPLTSSVSGLAGQAGHGLGLSTTEPPSLTLEDPTVLEAGMVVTIEPGFATEFGIFHVEQDVVVTEGGPEVLSAASPELHETGRRA